jgi:pyruvate carboxylase
MIRAIEEYEISGVETTLEFCHFVLQHEAFISGKFDTKFVEKYFLPELLKEKNLAENSEKVAALMAAYLHHEHQASTSVTQKGAPKSKGSWKQRRFH